MNRHTFKTADLNTAADVHLRIHKGGRYWTDSEGKYKYFSEKGRPITPTGEEVPGEFVLLQYVVFAGQGYYPKGGWDDFVGSWDDANDAMKSVATEGHEWIQVVDIHTGNIIHEGSP